MKPRNLQRAVIGAVLAGASIVGVSSLTSVAHALEPTGTKIPATQLELHNLATRNSKLPADSTADQRMVDLAGATKAFGDSFQAASSTIQHTRDKLWDVVHSL
jgi:hypothetical protein